MAILNTPLKKSLNSLKESSYRGKEIIPFLQDLGRLRVEIFRDYPYLYAGNIECEADYTQMYRDSPNTFFTVLTDGDQVVGISIAIPLVETSEMMRNPFLKMKMEPQNFFYFGESVLKPDYRGQRLYKSFFDLREEEALRQGYKFATFISVMRDVDDPAKPENYVPLNETWTRYGYRQLNIYLNIPYPTVERRSPLTKMALNEEGDIVPHKLEFWFKELV